MSRCTIKYMCIVCLFYGISDCSNLQFVWCLVTTLSCQSGQVCSRLSDLSYLSLLLSVLFVQYGNKWEISLCVIA